MVVGIREDDSIVSILTQYTHTGGTVILSYPFLSPNSTT